MQYWLVMPAAGAGRRFGGAKQFASLGQRTVLELALQPFAADAQCLGGSIALSPDEPRRAQLAARVPSRFGLVAGGATRALSVVSGLAALAGRAGPEDWVLVHDAARPCLSGADLARLLGSAGASAHGGLLATPVADTVKQALVAGPGEPTRCAGTLARDSLWLAQTPQMFRYGPLRTALEQAHALGRSPTDEAQAMEWQGEAVLLVEARDANIKVTSAADLLLAQAILHAREARST
ncbi:MAG TPA: 2-C-methyl-D-erythritol 4-phosphate cytidylyltransferase [Steroidobacteraceae bacterium]